MIQTRTTPQIESNPRQAEKIKDDLQAQLDTLSIELKKLDSQYNAIRECYKHETLQRLSLKECKSNTIWESSDLVQTPESKKTGLRSLKILKDSEILLMTLVLEIDQLKKYLEQIKQINYETQRIANEEKETKEQLLTAIEQAAKTYCILANKNINTNKIEQILNGGKVFAYFFPVRFNGESFFSVKNPGIEVFSLPDSVSSLNYAIKVSLESKDSAAEVNQAISLLNTEIRKCGQELKSKLEIKLDSKNSQLIYKSSSNSFAEVSDVSGLITKYSTPKEVKEIIKTTNKLKELSKIFNQLKPEFDADYQDFKKNCDLSEEKHFLDNALTKLTEAWSILEKKHITNQSYSQYRHAHAEVLKFATTGLNNKKSVLQYKFENLKSKYDGALLETEYKKTLFENDKLYTQSAEALRKYRIDQAKLLQWERQFEQQKTMKKLLNYLKTEILSDEKISSFWHQQATTWNFCCFAYKTAIGQGKDRQFYQVPTCVGKLKDRLRHLNIEEASHQDLCNLLFGENKDSIRGIIQERKKYGKGRRPATQTFLNALENFTRPGVNNMNFSEFENAIKNIRDKTGQQLVNHDKSNSAIFLVPLKTN